ncbi:MAG: MFS transporter, partial [Chlamydiae bacterium]|nr:MFS transporter [Chlamydiota bacterium]
MTISVVQKNSIFSMRAWAIWFLGATFMFYKYALEVSPSVMTGTLMKTFNITAVELGHLTACYFYAYLLLQIPAGILLDKFGPRKTTSVAILLCAIGCFIFSRADTFFMAGVGRFLTGAGAAFAAINCLKLINNWFAQRQFAFMAGLMMTMAMSGAVGGQAPLSAFIEKMDWRHAMEIISMSGFGLALLFWFVVRDHSPNMILSYKKSSNISLVDSLKQVLKNTQCWWLSVYSGFAFAPVMVFGGLWGVSFLSQSFKISQHFSAQMVSLIFIGFAVGAPIFGWLSDKLGRRCTVMYWGTLLAFLTISLVIYCPIQSIYILGFLLFVFGFSISSFLLCF